MRDDAAFLHELTAEQLLHRAVRACRSLRAQKGEYHPRWLAVSQNFSLGSTYSRDLCRKFDLDPDEEVRR